MYKLSCGDGDNGCGATTTIQNIGDSKDGFVYESFNGGFYICPNGCTDANVDVIDNQGSYVNHREGNLNDLTENWKHGSWELDT